MRKKQEHKYVRAQVADKSSIGTEAKNLSIGKK